MKILALDCATKTGWAWIDTEQREPISGVESFTKKRGDSNGMMFLRFNGWLDREWANDSSKPKAVYYERAHHRGGAATEIAVGLSTRVQEWCAKHNIECCAVHTSKLKKHVTGKGNASKAEVMQWFADTYDREPEDDNEADAMALLHYAMMDLGVK